MKCIDCGSTSGKNNDRDWVVLTVGGRRKTFCPHCFSKTQAKAQPIIAPNLGVQRDPLTTVVMTIYMKGSIHYTIMDPPLDLHNTLASVVNPLEFAEIPLWDSDAGSVTRRYIRPTEIVGINITTPEAHVSARLQS